MFELVKTRKISWLIYFQYTFVFVSDFTRLSTTQCLNFITEYNFA